MSIHAAIVNGEIKSIEDAIRQNPKCIFELDDHNFSPLHVAAKCGNKTIIKLLIDSAIVQNKIDYLMWETIGNSTAMEIALSHKQLDAIYTILQYKPDVGYKNTNGLTILHKLILATSNNEIDHEASLKLIEEILKAGIDPRQTDNGIDTYLDYLKMSNLPKAFWRLFLSYGAGIGFKYPTLCLDTEDNNNLLLLEYATEGQLTIGDRWGTKITRETPGFSKAITNLQEFIELFEAGKKFNNKNLLLVIKRILAQSVSFPGTVAIDRELTEIAKTLTAFLFPSLKEIVAKQVKFFHENAKSGKETKMKLSEEQIEALTKLPRDLQIHLIDEAGLDIPRPAETQSPPKKPS